MNQSQLRTVSDDEIAAALQPTEPPSPYKFCCSECGEEHDLRKQPFGPIKLEKALSMTFKCCNGCVKARVTITPQHIQFECEQIRKGWDDEIRINRVHKLQNNKKPHEV